MAKGIKTGGRQKGTSNKATKNARIAIANFIDGNADRLQGWLDQIAEQEGPKAAMACFIELVEYHVPKLARTELTTDKDNKGMAVVVTFVNPPTVPP